MDGEKCERASRAPPNARLVGLAKLKQVISKDTYQTKTGLTE